MKTNNLIIIGYARSGMTILDRVLSSDDRLVCLSEINTRYTCPTKPNTPYAQVKEWYEIDIKEDTTIKEIEEILEYCKENEKKLVIRDWSFGSFVPLKYNDFKPKKTLVTLDDIYGKFPDQFNTVCMVRNPVDIWLSMRDSVKTFHDNKLEYLLEFINDIKKRDIQIIKYENFCTDPMKTLSEIYDKLNIRLKEKLTLSNKVIGDVNFPTTSRGATLEEITELERRIITDEDKIYLRKETKAAEICELLEYKENLI